MSFLDKYKNCRCCGNVFFAKEKKNVFCSTECRNKFITKKHPKNCEWCGLEYMPERMSQKFCSLSCSNTFTKTIHGGTGTRLFNIWRGMLQRCFNQNHEWYHRYGGRGISVCDEWRCDFTKFKDWAMLHGYKDHLTIERDDNDGDYEPGNCRWATHSEQNFNRNSWTWSKNSI